MTPAELFFIEVGLPIPKWQEREAQRQFLNDLQPGQTAEMIEVLREENRNLRQGMLSVKAMNDELVEANRNQRRRILELEARINELRGSRDYWCDLAGDRLEP